MTQQRVHKSSAESRAYLLPTRGLEFLDAINACTRERSEAPRRAGAVLHDPLSAGARARPATGRGWACGVGRREHRARPARDILLLIAEGARRTDSNPHEGARR